MRSRTPRPAGFTVIELMTVVAIIGILSALAWWVPRLGRERAEIANLGAELQALLHEARQTALSESADVVVMFFPAYANLLGGVGRIVVYLDANGNHFAGTGTVSFATYTEATPSAEPGDQVVQVFDLPPLVDFGAVSTAALPAPYATIPVATACSFCASGRGAIRFDTRGRALFYSANGAPLQVVGGSVSLAVRVQGAGRPTQEGRTVAIASTTGSVRTFVR